MVETSTIKIYPYKLRSIGYAVYLYWFSNALIFSMSSYKGQQGNLYEIIASKKYYIGYFAMVIAIFGVAYLLPILYLSFKINRTIQLSQNGISLPKSLISSKQLSINYADIQYVENKQYNKMTIVYRGGKHVINKSALSKRVASNLYQNLINRCPLIKGHFYE